MNPRVLRFFRPRWDLFRKHNFTSFTFQDTLGMCTDRADAELVHYDMLDYGHDQSDSNLYLKLYAVSTEALGKGATQLLELTSLLDPDNIPKNLLRDGSSVLTDQVDSLRDPASDQKVISEYLRYRNKP